QCASLGVEGGGARPWQLRNSTTTSPVIVHPIQRIQYAFFSFFLTSKPTAGQMLSATYSPRRGYFASCHVQAYVSCSAVRTPVIVACLLGWASEYFPA